MLALVLDAIPVQAHDAGIYSAVQPTSWSCNAPGCSPAPGQSYWNAGWSWDHYFDTIYVQRNAGTLTCAPSSTCDTTTGGKPMTLGYLYWHEYSGAPSHQGIAVTATNTAAGTGIYNGFTDLRTGAGGTAPAVWKNSAGGPYYAVPFVYCSYVIMGTGTDLHTSTGCKLSTDVGAVATSTLTTSNFHFSFTSSDNQSWNGDIVETSTPPSGWGTPTLSDITTGDPGPHSTLYCGLSGATCGPAATFTDYVYDLRIDHPSFARNVSWRWKISFNGSWTATDLAHHTIATQTGAPFLSGGTTAIGFHVPCLPICGADTYTITVNDTDAGVTVSYDVDGTADGQLIATVLSPHIYYLAGCYNVTTNSCASPFTGAAGTAKLRVAFSGGDAVLLVCHQDESVGPTCHGATWSNTTVAAGTWDVVKTSVDTSLGFTILVQVTNVSGSNFLRLALDYSGSSVSGGIIKETDDAADAGASCSGFAPECWFRAILDELGRVPALFGDFFKISAAVILSKVEDAVNGIRSLMMAKQPFNYMVRAYDGVSAQLARASAAVTSTTTCPGVTFTVPMPSAYWPSGVSLPEWTVLRCADFEPLVSTTTYQTIRGAMDAAIYLLWGWAELRQLRPRLVAAA